MRNFKLEQSNEILITPTGLSAVGQILNHTSLSKRLNEIELPNAKDPEIKNFDIVSSYIGLLAQGKTNFDDIAEFRDLDSFISLLGINKVPSSPTLRQRLKKGTNKFESIIKEENINMLKTIDPDYTSCYEDYVPLDCDESPFDNSDTKKEGVSRTYKGFDGYAPDFAYLGKEGYLINTELKEGKAHSLRNAESFLKEAIENAQDLTNNNLLVRLDAGYDSKDILKLCLDKRVDFIIKRNLRNNDKDKLINLAREKGKTFQPREGKKVYRGSFKQELSELKSPLTVVFEITETTIDEDGQMLITPDREIDLYWTTLDDIKYDKVIKLYQKHGTSEQFHSEIKTDMDLERLPSGDFKLNQLVLIIGMLTYNILRLMGQISLKRPDSPLKGGVQRRRIRTVIQNLITIASKLVHHARQYILKFGSESPWFQTFKRVYNTVT